MPAAILLHLAPYIAMAVMGLGIWGLFEEHKADKVALNAANAQIVQNLKDQKESSKQLGIFQAKAEAADAKTQPVIQRIVSAPVTTGCGPTVGFAIDGLRDLYSNGAKARGPVPDKPGSVPAASPTPLGKAH